MFSFFVIKERERERNYRPELRSLIICNVQPNRVNSGFSGINGGGKYNKISKSHTSIYQPANPSDSTLFVAASLTMMAHFVKVGANVLFVN